MVEFDHMLEGKMWKRINGSSHCLLYALMSNPRSSVGPLKWCYTLPTPTLISVVSHCLSEGPDTQPHLSVTQFASRSPILAGMDRGPAVQTR